MHLIISAVTWEQALTGGMRQADLVPLAEKFGVEGVELREYWQDRDGELPELARLLTDQGISVVYATGDVLLGTAHDDTAAALRDIGDNIQVAETLGASVLRVNLGQGDFDPALAEAPWYQQVLQEVLHQAQEAGVVVAVENAPNPRGGDLRLLRDTVARVASPWLRLTFDTGNWLYTGREPAAALRAVLPYIGYVHLKDIVRQDGALQHSHLGTGEVDVAGLVVQLQQAGYRGLFALEFPGGDAPEERVQSSLAYLRQHGILA